MANIKEEMSMFKLSKNEMLFGNQGTMSQLRDEAEPVVNAINNKLINRRIKRLRKEIANYEAITRYIWRQYKHTIRTDGTTRDERDAARDRLREVMDVYNTKHKRAELNSLTSSIVE